MEEYDVRKFFFRNHDLLHSNTLDLHELHVKEAIQALENVLEERRNGKHNIRNCL